MSRSSIRIDPVAIPENGASNPRNVFSVDLEDYYMVSGFSGAIRFEDWDRFEGRIEGSTEKLLDLLHRHDVRATFFVLGWVARKYPDLIRRIHSNGHEIASHGYNHKPVFGMTPEEFQRDMTLTRDILEDITSETVIGYRAPSYSITRESIWALGILIKLGFRYDSSIFPIHHDFYGYPDFARSPVAVTVEGAGKILEIPMSTIRILGRNIPVCGGGYFRLYPFAFTEWSIRHLNRQENLPAIFYIHPWELDEGQPKVNAGAIRTLRHRINIAKTESRIRELLNIFPFCSFREWLSLDASASVPVLDVRCCAKPGSVISVE